MSVRGHDRHGTKTLPTALLRHATSLVAVGWMSGVLNLLALTGSFFMLQVYDRVIPSRSVPTLVGLGVLVLVLFALQAALESLRGRVLTRIGSALDAQLGPRVFSLSLQAPLRGVPPEQAVQPIRDLDQIRAFLASTGPGALFDLPWLPVYVLLCFLFHPVIGVAAIAGTILLVAMTAATELASRAPVRATTVEMARRQIIAEGARREAEALAALGMQGRMGELWAAANRDHRSAQVRAADISGTLGASSKAARVALQSGVLALGAWLVINNEASGGVIIAASILVARALAPAELAIANWKSFVATRQAWHRLAEVLRVPLPPRPLALPAPCKTLSAEAVFVTVPGGGRLVLDGVSLRLEAGQGLGVIGPSAAGKSSLVRTLIGVWSPVRGQVRLDGATLDQWAAEDLGRHIGYLPQEAGLIAGTIGQNIARFDPDADDAAVVAAAQAAGAHEVILRLAHGYETMLGAGGTGLSAGQRQRIGLARALYGNPFLVVLDEPNANLDAEGEAALTRAILGVRERGGICVIVAHRPSALVAVDQVLVLEDGRVSAFGPRDEIMRKVLRPANAAPEMVSSIRERA